MSVHHFNRTRSQSGRSLLNQEDGVALITLLGGLIAASLIGFTVLGLVPQLFQQKQVTADKVTLTSVVGS